jgi:hypothetical protein
MMRLTLKEKRSVTGVVAARYQKASKKEKRSMLDVGQTHYKFCNM